MAIKLIQKFKTLLYSCKARKLEINLTLFEYEHFMSMGCFYCGSTLLNSFGSSLDRFDNKRGYTFDNVVPCCKHCNIAKGTQTVDEFITWLTKAASYTNSRRDSIRADEKKDPDSVRLSRNNLILWRNQRKNRRSPRIKITFDSKQNPIDESTV